MPDRIREINNRFIEKVGVETSGNAYAKSQIITLDNKKEPYDVGIERADRFLVRRVMPVNDSINVVRDSYQARVDDGCRTDLFWRLVGITTTLETDGGGTDENGDPIPITETVLTNYELYCDQLSPGCYDPIGVSNETFNFDASKVNVMTQTPGQPSLGGYTAYDSCTKFGFTPQEGYNYRGWKVKEEPYSEDLVDPTLAVGVATMAFATNILTFEETQGIDQTQPLIPGIKEGGIITCDQPGLWFDNRTSIVSFGTTIVGLGTTTIAGVTTSTGDARKTFVETEDFAMRVVNYPERNGTITNFFVLQGPNDINYDKLALQRTSETADELSPYTPQRICMLLTDDSNLIGKGVYLEYNDNGNPTGCQEWNKFLEGQPDPADPINISGDADFTYNIVREPRVGAGKVYFREGFTVRPLMPGGGAASRGSSLTIEDITQAGDSPPPVPVIYGTVPSTCPSLDAAIPIAESERDDLVNELNNELGDPESRTSKLYALTNALREERNELNLRIWAFRLQMGEAETNVGKWDSRIEIINDPDFYDILQLPLTDSERTKMESKKRRPSQ